MKTFWTAIWKCTPFYFLTEQSVYMSWFRWHYRDFMICPIIYGTQPHGISPPGVLTSSQHQSMSKQATGRLYRRRLSDFSLINILLPKKTSPGRYITHSHFSILEMTVVIVLWFKSPSAGSISVLAIGWWVIWIWYSWPNKMAQTSSKL